MIGMLLGRAAMRVTTNGVSAATKGGTPAKDVKPTPCHPAAIAMAAGLFLVIVIASIAGGGQVVGWITPVACLMGLILLGGMFAAGAGEAKAKARKIAYIPGNPNVVPSAAELNAYYATLRADPARDTVPTVAMGYEKATREVLSQPRKRPTLRSINEMMDAEIRRGRVNDILKAPCPTCTANGDLCTFHPGQMVTKLDEGIIVHSTRVSHALKTGTAKLEDVKAQFKGRIPEDIIAGAL